VDTRNPSEVGRRSPCERGTTSVQMLVLLVPVIFGLMGFAVDLGRLYLIRGELKTAANAMALAAAQQLIGTEAALENATAMALLTLDQGSGIGNRYNFGMLRLGETTGLLASEMPQLAYFATLDAALAGDETASQASGTEARYVRVTVSAEAPLTFWGLLSLGAERKTLVRAQAVAGISAPLCTACGIEPIAIPAPNPQDSVHFDLRPGTRYTFAHWCQSGRPPQALRDDARDILYYVLLNPYDEEETPADGQTQLYRFGAQGLRRSNGRAVPCVSIGSPKETWPGTGRTSCDQSVPPGVTSFLCGLATRLLDGPPQGCEGFSELESPTDRDLEDRLDYASYQGNARRVITVAVMRPEDMTVLGFRQFLLVPLSPDVPINPSDPYGRFVALYIGYPVPLRQGRFDRCEVGDLRGPGKVVLHQ